MVSLVIYKINSGHAQEHKDNSQLESAQNLASQHRVSSNFTVLTEKMKTYFSGSHVAAPTVLPYSHH